MEREDVKEPSTSFLVNPIRWTRERWKNGGLATKLALIGAAAGVAISVFSGSVERMIIHPPALAVLGAMVGKSIDLAKESLGIYSP